MDNEQCMCKSIKKTLKSFFYNSNYKSIFVLKYDIFSKGTYFYFHMKFFTAANETFILR